MKKRFMMSLNISGADKLLLKGGSTLIASDTYCVSEAVYGEIGIFYHEADLQVNTRGRQNVTFLQQDNAHS